MKICYVILHFLASDETIECVESIINSTKNSQHDTKIIVVDNGSYNDSYEILKKKFDNINNIILIKSDKNLGFAKGNNLGFMYAKNILQSDFIVLLNNDTIIKQDTINDVIVEKFKLYDYAVLGPDIITLDNLHQNPRQVVNWKLSKIYKFRLKKKIQYLLTYIHFLDKYLTLNSDAFLNKKVNEDKLNVQLHGACFIFSRNYINKFNGLYDRTFLYMEEDILRLRIESNKLLMMYTPDITIYHKEDIATNMMNKKSIIKKRNIYKNLLISSKIYLKLKKTYYNESLVRKIVENTAKKIKGKDYLIDKKISSSYLLGIIFKRIMMIFRGINKIGLKNIKLKVFIGKNVKIKNINNVSFNQNVTINNGCYLDALSEDGIYLGNNCSLGENTIIRCSGNLKQIGKGFHIGNNSSLADNCFVGATGGVWIGNNVIGGQNIRFHSSNHNFSRLDIPIKEQGISSKGIYIGDNCWIGAGAVFCDGTSVDEGCVVAANSVVTKNFPKNCVIGGNPAKIIKLRKEDK